MSQETLDPEWGIYRWERKDKYKTYQPVWSYTFVAKKAEVAEWKKKRLECDWFFDGQHHQLKASDVTLVSDLSSVVDAAVKTPGLLSGDHVHREFTNEREHLMFRHKRLAVVKKHAKAVEARKRQALGVPEDEPPAKRPSAAVTKEEAIEDEFGLLPPLEGVADEE